MLCVTLGFHVIARSVCLDFNNFIFIADAEGFGHRFLFFFFFFGSPYRSRWMLSVDHSCLLLHCMSHQNQ